METNIKNYVVVVLVISLAVNLGYFVYHNDSKLKNNAFCAGFKDQASKRIKTYYSDGTLENIYPDEIFYSKKKDSCIAVWSGSQSNYALNGYVRTKVIFDAITNENIASETFYHFNDDSKNEDFTSMLARQKYYDETLQALR